MAGLKLLILGLQRHNPELPVRLRCPGASSQFRSWLERHTRIDLIDERLPGSGSFNVKPAVLLDGLSVADQCLWLDTDIIVNSRLNLLEADPADVVIVAQDPWEYELGSSQRSKTWGFTAGRDLAGPLNSAVVRVSNTHTELLGAWQEAVSRDSYLQEQRKPVLERNPHLLSDQDALSALLASTRFQHIPVRTLHHSKEILQHHGAGAYGIKQRWQNLQTELPPLIHAMGTVKPWKAPNHPRLVTNPRNYYERTYLELSPYVHVARQYRSSLEEETSWMNVQTFLGRIDSYITLGNPCLKGALQATAHRTLRRLP